MKKTILALVLVLAMLVPSFGMAAFTDGTYTAEAKGMMGPVAVTVTVEGGAIAAVTADVSGETPAIAGGVPDVLVPAIIAAQSTEVDGVASATVTSNAIKAAVQMCLALCK